jgi:ureidoglycolate hydrolase
MNEREAHGLEIAAHDAPGYKPLIRSGGDWMAALMNGTANSWRVPQRIEKHPATDELFVLLAGRGVLIVAGDGDAPAEVQQVEMKRHVLYNVKAGVWHASPMSPDGRFLIIEKTGTEVGGSVYAPLTDAQKAAIRLQ